MRIAQFANSMNERLFDRHLTKLANVSIPQAAGKLLHAAPLEAGKSVAAVLESCN